MLTAVYDLERYCKASERCEMSSRFQETFCVFSIVSPSFLVLYKVDVNGRTIDGAKLERKTTQGEGGDSLRAALQPR